MGKDVKEIVIVGNGPSLYRREYGEQIDSFDTVIRIGDYYTWQKKKDHGSKTDYVAVRTNGINHIKDARPSKGIWVHRRIASDREVDEWKRKIDGLLENAEFCKENWRWGERLHRECGTSILSQGFSTIAIAAEKLKPNIIYIGGMDNLMAGREDYYWTNYTIKKYDTHCFSVERRLLDEMKEEYGFDIIEMGANCFDTKCDHSRSWRKSSL